MLKSLFGRRRPTRPPRRDMVALATLLSRPAVQALTNDAPARSYFGGEPGLPAGSAWPEWRGARLDFLARISLGELKHAHRVPWLPDEGALVFFYDMNEQPWGFDPQDRGRWAVQHVPDDVDAQPPTASATIAALPRRNVAFRRVDVLPSLERDPVQALGLTDEEADVYAALTDAPFGTRPKHQIDGFPAPVQGDEMEFECELVSSGIYCGDATGYSDPRARALRPRAQDWRLLLQLDTDDDLGVVWGDGGLIYFWVRETEARAGNFANVWLVLQCT